MKKKYFAPEMEEVDLGEPVVLEDKVGSGGEDKLCVTGYTCDHSGGYE